MISRKLFTRAQSNPDACNRGFGLPNNSPDANCDYQKAPFFNVLAAYWIQFMTHDWFSHMEEGHNAPELMEVGCTTQMVNGVETPLTPEMCRSWVAVRTTASTRRMCCRIRAPEQFTSGGRTYLARAPKTFSNNNTAWWDASQLYGYDETSVKRVKRDPNDPAKMLLEPVAGVGGGYLPVLSAGDPIQPQWAGQESVAFPDNWTIGLSFYHNLFAREHNSFVDEFRRQAATEAQRRQRPAQSVGPEAGDSQQGRQPDELFEVARLVVAAEIAKIHTIEWTPQLLYDEPLYKGMNANWNGLLGTGDPDVSKVLARRCGPRLRTIRRTRPRSRSGIRCSRRGREFSGWAARSPHYDITNPNDVNGGVNHFGSPFNFPEEFVTVYRLHPLVPDLIEYRDVSKDPNQIVQKVAVIETFEGKATDAMRSRGLANWGLSMGRQRLGLLTLHNHPQFLQNIRLPRLDTPTQQIDIAALDLIRDREHGVPRFNEFRRQYGLRPLTSYDDFVDQHLPADSAARKEQVEIVSQLREVYGTHVCDASKVITDAQVNEDGSPINDCLGHPERLGGRQHRRRGHGGRLAGGVDAAARIRHLGNAVCGVHPERVAPAVQRSLLHVEFPAGVLHAAGRRLGEPQRAGGPMMEAGTPNGHKQPVSPLKRVLMRNMPELDCPNCSTWSMRSIPGGAIAGNTTRWSGSRGRTR